MAEVGDDLYLLHEEVLEENEAEVRDLLKSLRDEGIDLRDLLGREVRLENDPDWGMSAVHRAAAVGNTAILSLLLHSADMDINVPISKQGLTPLHLAAAEGHTPMVNYLASNGAQVNAVDHYGRSALHLAAEEGHRDVAQILGVKSANSTIQDNRGQNPLHVAASKGHAKMVSHLVKKTELLEARDDLGQTPLHKAMSTAALDVCEILLFHDVDVNVQDVKGNTPLHLGIQGFSQDLQPCRSMSPGMVNGAAETLGKEVSRKSSIDAVLNAGCEVNLQNEAGDTPLHLAVATDVLDVVKILLDRKAKVNSLNKKGCSPLFFCRNSLAVRLLVDHGAVTMVRDNWKNTALHQFCMDNDLHSDIIDTVVELRGDVNAKNVNEQSALFRACESGHLEKVKKLLDYGADYNVLDKNKKSLLHVALEANMNDVAYFLVDKVGLNVQSADENGTFPLHLAVINGDLNLCDLLIKRGASVNVSDRKTTTPASLAILHGHYDILRLLIQNGAKVDDNTAGSEAPLNLFAKCDDVINVCRLLDQGLDINRADTRGRTSLHDAITAKAYNVAKELLSRGASAKTTDKTGESPLHRAAYACDDDDIFISLLQNSAQINQTNANHETALHISVRNNRPVKVLQLLVQHGADVLAFDKTGSCPLHCVISESGSDQQCQETLQCLLSHDGINLDVTNNEGKSLLHMAAKRQFPISCRLLLEHGAAVDMLDREGRSALHHACMLDRCDVTKVLIKAKAQLDVLDAHGASPLYYAVKSGVFETVELLLSSGADCGLVANGCQYPLHEALASCNTDLVELFLMNDCDVSYTDTKKRTVLHLAAPTAPACVIATMLNMGADVKALDSHANSPLHLATRNSDIGVARLLLDRGASVNAQNKDGNSPLHLSCLHGTYAHVNLLLERGADFSLCNAIGETALHLAAKSDDLDALELLISQDAEVDVIDMRGQTPFLVALAHENFPAATTLAEQGANVGHVDNEGQSALHKVAVMSTPLPSVISMLYKRGLSAHLRDNHGNTPLSIAREETLQLLTKLRLDEN